MRQLIYTTLLLLILTIVSYGQAAPKKHYFPIWTYHQKNVNIYGLSLGLGSFGEPTNTNSNGIKIELIGAGIIIPLIPSSPISKSDSAFRKTMSQPFSERINGFSLSASGTACECKTNGISAGFIGQINGLSGSLYMDMAESHNGVQLALFTPLLVSLSPFGPKYEGYGKRVKATCA